MVLALSEYFYWPNYDALMENIWKIMKNADQNNAEYGHLLHSGISEPVKNLWWR